MYRVSGMSPEPEITKIKIMTELRIGFANRYFTLWSVNVNWSTDSMGRSVCDANYEYIKNLSTVETKAIEKAIESGVTNLDIAVELKGKNRSFVNKPTTFSELDPSVSPFVIYKGIKTNNGLIDNMNKNVKVTEIDDIDFHKNYAYNVCNRYSIAYLINKGYDVTYSVGRYGNYYNVCIDEPKVVTEVVSEVAEIIIPTTNLYTYDDGLYNLTIDGVDYFFKDVKEMYYNGFAYYLPLNKKGKSVRIKNKKLKINASESINGGFLVTDFEIVK